MNKHTLGPWIVDQLNGPTGTHRPMLCVVTRDVTIAELDVDGGPSQDVRNANAALIAAAPELLEAATEAYKWLAEIHAAGGHTRSDARFHALGAAIAKAEG